jgi:hypothetical protein
VTDKESSIRPKTQHPGVGGSRPSEEEQALLAVEGGNMEVNGESSGEESEEVEEIDPARGDEHPSEGGEHAREEVASDSSESEGEAVREEVPIKRLRNPSDPTPEERERHCAVGHLPYRPWCKTCVEARAKEDAHYKKTKDELNTALPMVGMDYAEVGEKEGVRKLLVGRDQWTKSVFSHLVQCKGLGDD